MEQIQNKRGKLIISRNILYISGVDVLSSLFSKFFPIRIDIDYISFSSTNDNLIYYGLSESFRVISECEVVPTYTAIITRNSDGSIYINFNETSTTGGG